jgi:hypothetical protein
MKQLLFVSMLFAALLSVAGENNMPNVQQITNKHTMLSFTENKGQITDQNYLPRPDIQFQLKAANGLTIFVGDGALHYQFAKADKISEPTNAENRFAPMNRMEQEATTYTMYRMDVELIGANKQAKIITENKQDYYEHYYTTGTGENGATAYAYNKITYQDIYPNIDWVLYTKNNVLKHEFVIRKGGNPTDIKLQYDGATNLALNNDGSLTSTTPQGTIMEQAPVAYTREGLEVKSNFVLQENELSYAIGNYEGDLVIDPTLEWATYYGGAGNDRGRYVVSDKSGNIYLSGETQSISAIATVGSYQTSYGGGNYDAMLVKFNSAGNRLWATYYGGTGLDYGFGVTVDSSNNVYCTGQTGSTTNIASTTAYQTTYGGAFDAFVVKLDSSGNRVFGTYYGGSGLDQGYSIVTDQKGHVYLSGASNSTVNIATPSSYQTTNSGFYDAYLVQFDEAGNRLWATYYGGTMSEFGIGLTADKNGNVFMTGYTGSLSGIATQNAEQTTFGGGGNDMFLAKFASNGVLQWGTYCGGNNSDYGEAVTTDHNGNVYVTGYTLSSSGIATANAYQPNVTPGGEDAFLMKFTNNGVKLWGTYYGGSGDDESNSIVFDNSGTIWISGSTSSNNSIASNDGYQTINGGGNADVFLAAFSQAGVFQWGSYLGGTGEDKSYGIAVGVDNQILLTGYTYSVNNIASSGAFQTVFGGAMIDAFLAVFAQTLPPVVDSISSPDKLCVGNTLKMTNTIPNGVWVSSDTSIANINSEGIIKGHNAGTVLISYVVTNAFGADTATKWMTVNNYSFAGNTSITPLSATTFCPGGNVTLQAPLAQNYLWNNGITANSTTVFAQGYYFVQLTDSQGCVVQSDSVWVTPKALPSSIKIKINGLPIVCDPNNVNYAIDLPYGSTTGFSYQWNKGGVPIIGATDSIYIASGASGGSVTLTVSGGGVSCFKNSSAKAYTIKPLPVASFVASGSITFCAGGSVTFSAPPISGYSYAWLNNGNASGSGTTKVIKVAGNYALVAKLNNCTDTSLSVTTVVNSIPVAGIGSNTATTFCVGDYCALTASSSVTANIYQWYNATALINTTSVATDTVNIAGKFKVVVTDINGCVSKASSVITTKVNPIPIATVTALGATTISSIGSVKLKASPSSGVAWQWYKDGNIISNATANQYTATSGGSYTVAITKLGCTGISSPFVVTQTTPKTDEGTTSFNEGSFMMTAYPNPIKEEVTVTIDGIDTNNGSLEIIDAFGRTIETVFFKMNNSSFKLQTATLSSGVYFIRFKDNDGRTGMVKVIKE